MPKPIKQVTAVICSENKKHVAEYKRKKVKKVSSKSFFVPTQASANLRKVMRRAAEQEALEEDRDEAFQCYGDILVGTDSLSVVENVIKDIQPLPYEKKVSVFIHFIDAVSFPSLDALSKGAITSLMSVRREKETVT